MSSLTESEPSLTFIAHPSSQTVSAGSHVTFKCSVLFHRKITYEWHHNNKTIRTDKQPRFAIRSDGSLRIAKTDLDDAGVYQCIAILTAKRSKIVRKKARSRTAKLTVEGKSLYLFRVGLYKLNFSDSLKGQTKVTSMKITDD